MISQAKVIFAIACGLLAGLAFSFPAYEWMAGRNAPLVTGQVVARTPTSWLSIPRVDFSIKIDGTETIVHARTQRGMMNKVPASVRFHYTGDPAKNIILTEHELNPVWLVLFFWGASAVLASALYSKNIRFVLGWETKL